MRSCACIDRLELGFFPEQDEPMIQTVILRRERGERRKRDERVRGAREGIVCACVCVCVCV
jgi:hypothetical protein